MIILSLLSLQCLALHRLVYQCVLPSSPPQCVYKRLATVKTNYNESAVVSTKFSLTVEVESWDRNATLCR